MEVDIFFQEEARLGVKMYAGLFTRCPGGCPERCSPSTVILSPLILVHDSELGEKIIKALIKMKCPFPLQTQQIQGLDFINIFPVIQWLVKKVRSATVLCSV